MPLSFLYIPVRVAKRAFVSWVPGENDCHISTYSVASHGYAQIGWHENGRRCGTTAHRAAWVHVNGQIPKSMTVDHRPTCDSRCVNVKHLRLLTNHENGRRTNGRDWPLGQCINGHSNEHLHLADGGKRLRCKLCQRDEQRRYRARKKERLAP